MHIYKRQPASGQPPKSAVIFLHGLGADGQDLIGIADFWADLLPDTIFISPDAPEPCDMAPMGRQWFSLQDRRPDILLDGLRNAAEHFNSFFDTQLGELGLPPQKTALVGFSQGAMTALYVALRRPEKPPACVLAYSGALIGDGELSPASVAKVPIFLRHGEADEVVPPQAYAQARSGLERLDLAVSGESVPGLGHGIDPDGIQKGGAFLVKHLA